MAKILNRFTGKIIIENKDKSIKELVEYAIKNNINLARANLTWADLTWADLARANLTWADLTWADLARADLTRANLASANLTSANLTRANLASANLASANLTRANLTWANLTWANLTWANLTWANNIEFQQFPSIRTLSSIKLNKISDETILELMRLDADAHPYPELFDVWAKGGDCPYQYEERWWFMPEKREVWRKPGKPTMALRDLIIQICKEEGWGIKGILECKNGKTND